MIKKTNSQIEFGSSTALPLLKIETPSAGCLIALQGAHVLQFNATGRKPLLWVSPYAEFEVGKAIRGGIPVCAPWFGVNQRDPNKPKHGFLRKRLWTVKSSTGNSVTLEYSSTESDLALFNYRFTACLEVIVGDSLTLNFSIENHSHITAPISWALHSYHPVESLSQTTVNGLNGCEYLDNTLDLSRHLQAGDAHFNGEFDRVYLDVASRQRINCDIVVSGENAPTAIVWNPGERLGESMPDIADAWGQYICLERGAAFDNEATLEAGKALHSKVVIAYGDA